MSKERLKWIMTTPAFNGDTVLASKSADLAAVGVTYTDLASVIKTRFGDIPLVYTVDEIAKATAEITGIIDEWLPTAQKIYATASYTYDPLDEFKEYEKTVRTPNVTKERTPNLSEAETGSPSSTQENQVSAFSQSTYAPESKTTINDTLSRTIATTGTDKNTETGTETFETNRNGRRGKSAQELIEKERDIYVDLVSWFAEKFKSIFAVEMVSLWEVLGGIEI